MTEAKSVAVIGSLNIDYFTRVESLPAPGETVCSDSLDIFRGGKGANQAIAASRQGSEIIFIGTVGNDEHGKKYLKELAKEGIDTAHIDTVKDSTGAAFITVDRSGENMIVISSGANSALTREHIKAKTKQISSAGAVLGQFEVPISAILEAARIANQNEVPVIINPSPVEKTFPWEEIRTDYLLVNKHEATAVLGFSPWDEELSLVRQRLHELRVENLIVTRGGDDTLVYNRGDEVISIPTLPVLPIDTVGAGDAFAGCFAARIASGEALVDALAAANCAGALTTLGAGAQDPIPDRERVDQHLEHLAQSS